MKSLKLFRLVKRRHVTRHAQTSWHTKTAEKSLETESIIMTDGSGFMEKMRLIVDKKLLCQIYQKDFWQTQGKNSELAPEKL